MKSLFLLLVLVSMLNRSNAQTKIPSADIQIKLALLAAPEEKRGGAMVYGYDQNGKMIVLRKGTNEMICLADNPKQLGFSAACYLKDLDPYMQRGRELRASGMSEDKATQTRDDEVRAGKLKMNSKPAILYVLSAKDEDCDLVNGTVKNGYLRYVIYIPFATAENTGLPTSPPAPGGPWIMFPGTPRAHIMISPPVPAKQ
ncbi:MAG: hypothetical protein ACHQEM_12635 [Chitinophagales bacterium]